jgi:hypothetical protein
VPTPDVVLAGLDSLALDQVNLPTEDTLQFVLHREPLAQPRTGAGLELDQQVYVAVGSEILA